MGDFRFTPEQRKQLAEDEVSPKQIEKLEGRACLIGRAWLRKSPPRAKVSKRISALGKHLRAARLALEGILAGNAPECRAAEGFLGQAVSKLGKEAKLPDPSSLEALERICEDALTMLPKQTWHREADPRIIQWIYEDLVAGHGAEYCSLGVGDDWSATGPDIPPFTIKPSSSPGGPFRKIVSVCYEAMTGDRDADPERAIKAFIKQRAEQIEQREKQRALGALIEQIKQRAEQLGHQVP